MLSPAAEKPDLYCCCFSEDGDSLGQWRAYADDGRGVAIGLCATFLCGLRKEYEEVRREHVVYNRAAQEDIVTRTIELVKDYRVPANSKLPADVTEGLGASIAKVEIWRDAVKCKNPCFREEREV